MLENKNKKTAHLRENPDQKQEIFLGGLRVVYFSQDLELTIRCNTN
jgi:hypothetical protein